MPPLMASVPASTTMRGSGTASSQMASARDMFLVMGPVTTTPSAWRGEATNSMP